MPPFSACNVSVICLYKTEKKIDRKQREKQNKTKNPKWIYKKSLNSCIHRFVHTQSVELIITLPNVHLLKEIWKVATSLTCIAISNGKTQVCMTTHEDKLLKIAQQIFIRLIVNELVN